MHILFLSSAILQHLLYFLLSALITSHSISQLMYVVTTFTRSMPSAVSVRSSTQYCFVPLNLVSQNDDISRVRSSAHTEEIRASASSSQHSSTVCFKAFIAYTHTSLENNPYSLQISDIGQFQDINVINIMPSLCDLIITLSLLEYSFP